MIPQFLDKQLILRLLAKGKKNQTQRVGGKKRRKNACCSCIIAPDVKVLLKCLEKLSTGMARDREMIESGCFTVSCLETVPQ